MSVKPPGMSEEMWHHLRDYHPDRDYLPHQVRVESGKEAKTKTIAVPPGIRTEITPGIFVTVVGTHEKFNVGLVVEDERTAAPTDLTDLTAEQMREAIEMQLALIKDLKKYKEYAATRLTDATHLAREIVDWPGGLPGGIREKARALLWGM